MMQLPDRQTKPSAAEERRRDAVILSLGFLPHAANGTDFLKLASRVEGFLKDGTS